MLPDVGQPLPAVGRQRPFVMGKMPMPRVEEIMGKMPMLPRRTPMPLQGRRLSTFSISSMVL